MAIHPALQGGPRACRVHAESSLRRMSGAAGLSHARAGSYGQSARATCDCRHRRSALRPRRRSRRVRAPRGRCGVMLTMICTAVAYGAYACLEDRRRA